MSCRLYQSLRLQNRFKLCGVWEYRGTKEISLKQTTRTPQPEQWTQTNKVWSSGSIPLRTMIDSEQWSSVKKPVAEKPSATEQKKTESKKAKKPEQKIRHSWFRKDDQRQQIVQYAYQLWGMNLITMMECENGNRDIKIRGDGGYSVGICQIHTRYHRLPAEYYTSRQTQVELCNQKRKNWTKFYWPSRIVQGQKCSDFAKKRFYFE